MLSWCPTRLMHSVCIYEREVCVHRLALCDEVWGGLKLGYELGLVHWPRRLILSGRGQPHPKVVPAAAPVQLVVPVTCKVSFQ